jgi:hypothetical protein
VTATNCSSDRAGRAACRTWLIGNGSSGVDTATADPRAPRICRRDRMRVGSHVLSLSLDDVYRPTSESSSEDLCQLIGLEQNGICFHTVCPLRFFDQLLDVFVPNPKLA